MERGNFGTVVSINSFNTINSDLNLRGYTLNCLDLFSMRDVARDIDKRKWNSLFVIE